VREECPLSNLKGKTFVGNRGGFKIDLGGRPGLNLGASLIALAALLVERTSAGGSVGGTGFGVGGRASDA